MKWFKHKQSPVKPKEGPTPYLIPDEILVITDHGLVIEQYLPNIQQIAKEIPNSLINRYHRIFHKKSVYVVRYNNVGIYEPAGLGHFSMPAADSIKVSAAKMYAIVETYPKTIARMIRRRHKNQNSKITKGLKSTWVVILIVIVLFIIFMLVFTAVSGAKSGDNAIVEPTTETQQTTTDVKPATNVKPAQNTTPEITSTEGNVFPVEPPRGSKPTDVPRGVPIDGK